MYKNVMSDLEKYITSHPKFNSRIPMYNDDSDYTTNAPSYYDDLARKNKLMKTLALRIWEYEEEMIKRLEQWDKNLEDFPKDVKDLLEKWLQDGTLDKIINETIFSWKLDTEVFNDFMDKYGNQDLMGTQTRSLMESLTEDHLNALDFGVKGDGVTDDTLAIQEFITYCEDNNKTAFFPSNVYYVPGTVKTRNQPSYHYTPGLTIKGSGKTTIFKGKGADPVNYQSNLDEQAMFNIFSNNNIITDIAFLEVKAPFYFGKDKRTDEGSHSSFNVIERIWMEFVGTGFIIEPDVGFYYNKIRDVHIAHFQIGIDFNESSWTTQPNANRNIFEAFRLTRGWLGFHILGDGNSFIGCYGENIKGNQAVGHRPYKLPDHEEIKGTGGMWYFHDKGRNNRISHGSNEDIGFDVYDEGYKNHYFGNRFEDFSSTPTVYFPDLNRTPGSYIGESVKLGFLEYAINSNSMWGTGAGLYVVGGRIQDKGWHRQSYRPEIENDMFLSIHTASRSRFNKLGNILKWTSNIRFELSPDFDIHSPIQFKLPKSDLIKVEPEIYHSQAINGVNMIIGGITGTANGTIQNTKPLNGYFITENEISYLVIDAPELGWRNDVNTNVVTFDLNINVVNK